MKKINQFGMLSLHVMLPVAIAIAVVAGVGSYVLKKSGASADKNTASFNSCGVLKRSGNVYSAAVGTQFKFSGATNNDSIRNIAYGLCKRGYLDNTTAQAINSSGNYDAELQKSLSRFQIDTENNGATTTGVPTKMSLIALKLTPIGF